MAVSVRMDPLLEKELDVAAKQRGITKSQFIVEAVERALGKKDPYALMQQLKAKEERLYPGMREAFAGTEQPYATAASRRQLLARLKKKHGVGGAR
jgi:predicted DNA-binding protein